MGAGFSHLGPPVGLAYWRAATLLVGRFGCWATWVAAGSFLFQKYFLI
jgi:hypothetical protein